MGQEVEDVCMGHQRMDPWWKTEKCEIKGNSKSNNKWAKTQSKRVKNSDYTCWGYLCPSVCKKIQIVPVGGISASLFARRYRLCLLGISLPFCLQDDTDYACWGYLCLSVCKTIQIMPVGGISACLFARWYRLCLLGVSLPVCSHEDKVQLTNFTAAWPATWWCRQNSIADKIQAPSHVSTSSVNKQPLT